MPETQEDNEDTHTVFELDLVEHPTNYAETLMHLIRGNVGTGIFAMGDAFKNSGMLVAPWLTLLIGIIATHSEHLLIKAADKMIEDLNVTRHITYARTVELCFEEGPISIQQHGNSMRILTNIFICITHFGFCCVYVVFIAANLKNVLDINGLEFDIHYHILIVFVPILLTCWVRKLKFLAPLSVLANVLTLVACLICIYYCSIDIPPVSSRKYFVSYDRLPLFFGTVTFSYLSIGLVLPLRNEMRNPKMFCAPFGVLNVGMSFVSACLILMGFLSYLKYGEDVLGSVTLNLDEHDILAQCVKITTSASILFTYPLQFYVLFRILFRMFEQRYGPFIEHLLIIELSFRTVLVVVICNGVLAAAMIPYLELFISLVGAFTGAIILLVIPPILEFVICLPKSEVTAWIIIKNALILLVALIGFFSGTYVSLKEIIVAIGKRDPNDITVAF